MKKVGIGCDNYKINKFKSELKEIGITEISIKPLSIDTSFLTIKIQVEKVADVARVCQKVEFYFKNRN